MSSDESSFLSGNEIQPINQDQEVPIERQKLDDTETNEIKLFEVNKGLFRNGFLPRRYRKSVESQIPPKYPPKCPRSQPRILSVNQPKIYFVTEKNEQTDSFDEANQSNLLDQSYPYIRGDRSKDHDSLKDGQENKLENSAKNMSENAQGQDDRHKSHSFEQEMVGENQELPEEIAHQLTEPEENVPNQANQGLEQQSSMFKSDDSQVEKYNVRQQPVNKCNLIEKRQQRVGSIQKSKGSKSRNQSGNALQGSFDQRQNHSKNKDQNMVDGQIEENRYQQPHHSHSSKKQTYQPLNNQILPNNLNISSLSITNKLQQTPNAFQKLILNKSHYSLLMLEDNLIILQQIQQQLQKAIQCSDVLAVTRAEDCLNQVYQENVNTNYSIQEMEQELSKCMGVAEVDGEFVKAQFEKRLINRLEFIRNWHKTKISVCQYQTHRQISRLREIQSMSVSRSSTRSLTKSQRSSGKIQPQSIKNRSNHNSINRSNRFLTDSILMNETSRTISSKEILQRQCIDVIEDKSPQSLINSGLSQPSPIVGKSHTYDSAKSMAKEMNDVIKEATKGQASEFVLAEEVSGRGRYVMGEERFNTTKDLKTENQKNESHQIGRERKQSQSFEEQINDYLRKIVGVVKDIAQMTENNQDGDEQNINYIDEASEIIKRVMQIISSLGYLPKNTVSQISQQNMVNLEKQKQNSIQNEIIQPQTLVQTSDQLTQTKPKLNSSEMKEILNLSNYEVQRKGNPHIQRFKHKELQEKATQVESQFQSADKLIQTHVPLVENQSVQVPIEKAKMKIQNTCSQKISNSSVKNKAQLKVNSKIITAQVIPEKNNRKPFKNMSISSNQTNQSVKPNPVQAAVSHKRLHPGVISIKIESKKEEPKVNIELMNKRQRDKVKQAYRTQLQRIEEQRSVREDQVNNLNTLFWSNITRGPDLVNKWIQQMRSRQMIQLNLIRYRNNVLIQYLKLCLKQYPLTINERFNEFRKRDNKILKAFREKNIRIPEHEIKLTEQLLETVEQVMQRYNCERRLDFHNI